MDKYFQLVGLLVAGCIVLVLVAFLLGAASAAFRAGASKMDRFAGVREMFVVETATPRIKTAMPVAGPPPGPPAKAGMATDAPAVFAPMVYRVPLVVQMPSAPVRAAAVAASPLASAAVDNWKQAPLEFNGAQKPRKATRKRGEGKNAAKDVQPAPQEPTPQPERPVQQQRSAERTAPPVQQQEEPPRATPRQQRDSGSRKPFTEQSWAGRLTSMGVETRQFGKDKPYDCYNVRIEEDSGGINQQWGVDLERAIKDAGAQPGDLIRLSHVGYAPTSVQEPGPDGTMKTKTGRKKLFHVDITG